METAIVGVLGALVGILISNGLALLLDIRRRREREKDVQTSLRAEIRTHWRRLAPEELEGRAKTILAKMKDGGGKPFTSLIPREDRTPIFDAIVREIHVLPTSVIDPVCPVLLEARRPVGLRRGHAERSPRDLETDRQIRMYEDYITMQNQARELAEVAIGAIDAALKENEA